MSEHGPWDGEPAPPRRDEVAERILALVRRRELQPGDALPTEAELGRVLRASRSSVREALRILQARDQVEVRHGQGTFVGPMGLAPLTAMLATRAQLAPGARPDAVAELRAVLTAVESAAAEDLVAAAAEDRDRLVDLAAGIRATALAGEPVERQCRELHRVLLLPVRGRLVGELAEALWAAAVSVAATAGEPEAFPGWRAAAVGEVHESLAAAVSCGSGQDLRAALRELYLGPGG